MRKLILQSALFRSVICWIASLYVRFVSRTTRWTVVGWQHLEPHLKTGDPVVGAFWHSRMMMMPYFWTHQVRNRRMFMLISSHRDGLLISRLVGLLGISTIAGSSSRRAVGAMRGILRALKSGESVAFTPDGPRGPRMRASMGPIFAARMSGKPIMTVTYSVSRRRLFNSWDRFLLPLPFSRGVIALGPLLSVPADADGGALENYRIALEDLLNDLTRQADELCGWQPIEPASDGAAAGSDLAFR